MQIIKGYCLIGGVAKEIKFLLNEDGISMKNPCPRCSILLSSESKISSYRCSLCSEGFEILSSKNEVQKKKDHRILDVIRKMYAHNNKAGGKDDRDKRNNS